MLWFHGFSNFATNFITMNTLRTYLILPLLFGFYLAFSQTYRSYDFLRVDSPADTETSPQTSRETVWANDFSNPADWSFQTPSGLTNWAIRNTGPAGVVSAAMGYIRSSSACNKFAIYDADYSLGSLGKEAYITLVNPVNLSSFSSVTLEFEQYFQSLSDSCFVGISTNGTSWTYININTGMANHEKTDNPKLVRLNISSLAANRPQVWLRFGYKSTASGYAWMIDNVALLSPKANDAKVLALYSMGEIPVGAGSPHTVSTIIRNDGTNILNNLQVNLEVSGANTFSNTKTISSLAAGAQDTVYFNAYSPGTTGVNNVRVYVPSDMDNSDNEIATQQSINGNTYSYCDNSAIKGQTGTGQAGYTVAKYQLSGTKALYAVQAYIGSQNTIGKQIYGVLLNSAGVIIDSTATLTIAASDTGQWKTFVFDNPQVLNNTSFYAGIGQKASAGNYYPIGTQHELPVRKNAYFWGTSGNLQEFYNFGRPCIKAIVAENVPDVGVSQLMSPQTSCQQPLSQSINIAIRNYGTVTITAGTSIPVSYTLNGGSVVSETISLASPLLPAASIQHIFSNPIDISTPDTDYHFVFYTDLATDGAKINDTMKVTISTYSYPLAILGNDTSLCGNADIVLQSPEEPGVFYTWYLQENLMGSGQSLSLNATNGSGTYYLHAENANGCISTDSINIVFMESPTVNLGFSDTTLCVNAEITLNAGAFPNATYRWYEISAQITLSETSVFTISETGTYIIEKGIPACNEYVFDTVNINIPRLDLGADVLNCNYDTLYLNAGTLDGYLYVWRKFPSNNIISFDSIVEIRPLMGSGTYYVNVSKGFCTATDSLRVTFGTPVTVNITSDSLFVSDTEVEVQAIGNAGLDYIWTFDGFVDTIGTAQQITIDHAVGTGMYYVSAYNTDGCYGIDSVYITFTTGIGSNLEQRMRIYPNPANNYITIELPENGKSNTVYIKDINDRIVGVHEISGKTNICLKELSPGMYIVHVPELNLQSRIIKSSQK